MQKAQLEIFLFEVTQFENNHEPVHYLVHPVKDKTFNQTGTSRRCLYFNYDPFLQYSVSKTMVYNYPLTLFSFVALPAKTSYRVVNVVIQTVDE